MWQVVEKEDYGTDWHQVRYDMGIKVQQRFNTEEEAMKVARDYVTKLNCDNSLAKGEMKSAAEAFMMIPEGCFMGVLDGKDWFLTYPKDIKGKLPDGSDGLVHKQGDKITDSKYYELEGKTEVKVRSVK